CRPMAETSWAVLRGLLAERYEELKGRLARRLGSEELASECLHETWLRLHRAGNAEAVESPPAYLLHVAFNIARDRLRADNRRARQSEIDAVRGIADPMPGPDRAGRGARGDLSLGDRPCRHRQALVRLAGERARARPDGRFPGPGAPAFPRPPQAAVQRGSKREGGPRNSVLPTTGRRLSDGPSPFL